MGRAIVREPAVFLFAEPLSNLDAKLRVQMRLELKQQITARELTTVDNSMSRDFVREMIKADVARMESQSETSFGSKLSRIFFSGIFKISVTIWLNVFMDYMYP